MRLSGFPDFLFVGEHMQQSSVLEQARLALAGGHDLPVGALSTKVVESWQRCRERGLDPEIGPRGMVLSFAEVQRRREELRICRRLALAEMQALHAQISGSSCMIAFADRHGLVIDTVSDAQFAQSRAGKSIIPGSIWSEHERGTNALGLSLASGESAAVYGREHYFSGDGYLNCIAAPIFNAAGSLVGAIDASYVNAARQHHTQALLKMAATQIGNALFFQEQPGFYIFAFHPRAEFLGTLSTGLIALSNDGEIMAVNRNGETLLSGLPIAGTTGLHFEDVFDCLFGVTMNKLLAGEQVQIRDKAGSGVFIACRQIARGVARTPIARAASVSERPMNHARQPAAAVFVCQDPGLREALKELDRAATIGMPVHISGETGTGKELVARMVHRASGRSGEFVAVNCGAIPETLFVAELFGHEKGAYTSASTRGAPGLIRLADRGTLFLDEVADIPPSAQAALLRFLDDMKVRPLGGVASCQVDVQIVSATNQDLVAAVTQQRFRADLLYRLNACTLTLPPLRERLDFAAIVRHLLLELGPHVVITDAAIERLQRRNWPGNVRELRSHLQLLLLRHAGADVIDADAVEQAQVSGRPVPQACPGCSRNPLDRHRCLEIRAAFLSSGRNVARTARLLGLSRTTVYKHVGREFRTASAAVPQGEQGMNRVFPS